MPMPRDADRTPVEQLKTDYAGLMRVMHRSLRRARGGASEVARLLNQDETLFLNKFNPSDFEHAPNLWLFLATVDYLRCRETAHAVASLADCLTVPAPAASPSITEHAAIDALRADMIQAQLMLDGLQTSMGSALRDDLHRHCLRMMASAHALARKLQG